MKIRDVCAKTGLTDRAVRFYIENGLVFPEKKENYAGRRNFDFSDDDVAALEDVALLRAAGFSIDQIKRLGNGTAVRAVIDERSGALESEKIANEKTIAALASLKDDPVPSKEKLLDALRKEPEKQPVPASDNALPVKKIVKRVIVIAVAATLAAAVLLAMLGAALFYERFVGLTRVTVFLNGKMLSTNEYTVRQHKDSDSMNSAYRASHLTARGYSYYAFTDYGPDFGVITLNDGFEVEFGFFNTNNWHKVNVTVEIERNADGGGIVTQKVSFISDAFRLFAQENSAEFSGSDGSCSVISGEL